jgi:exosortase/archaeosortase family protein
MSKTKRAAAGLSWAGLKREWGAWGADKAPVFVFAGKFGALVAVLYIFLALPFGDRLLYRDLEFNAWLADASLRLLGQGTHLTHDVVIQSSRFSMGIRRGCDAVEPTWLLCAAMLAFPAGGRKKLVGIVLAIAALQILNLVRILSLYWIGVHLPSFFNSAHLEWWPVLFLVTAILLFLRWKGGAHGEDRGPRA